MFIDDKDDSKALNSIQKILLHNLQKKHYLREKNIQFLNRILNTNEYHNFNTYVDTNNNEDVYMDVDVNYNTQSDTQDNTQGDIKGDKDTLYNIKKSVEFSKSPIVKESTASQVLNTITDFIFN